MEQLRAWIAGGYEDAGSVGLYLLRQGRERLHVERLVAPIRNISAGVRRDNLWYLADEVAGEVVVVDDAANWREIARFASGGQAPCHLALNAGRNLLAVANYEDGTTALFTLDDRGLPIGDPDRYRHYGRGTDPERQAGPHAHWVGFASDDTLYATDLGSDCVLGFTPDGGRLGPARIVFAAPPGSGPRQIAFHPDRPIIYLLSELASTLTVLDRRDDGVLIARQCVSTLQAPSDSLGGAILIDGRHLHVTNRGDDSVATFAIKPDGTVLLIGHRPSGGVSPRFLAIDGGNLLVAHEKQGGVTLLARDGPVLARADVPGAAFLGAM